MTRYFDLKALPDPEIIQSAIIAQLMQALHGLLPRYQGRLGLDFPGYGQQRTLGGIIRIIGNQADIADIHKAVQTDSTCRDYALIGQVNTVPDKVETFACYHRRHVKGNSRLQRQKKRHQQRGSWNAGLEQAMLAAVAKPSHLPHVVLSSKSTGQRFILFIDKQVRSVAVEGEFNAYGLSTGEGTLPVF